MIGMRVDMGQGKISLDFPAKISSAIDIAGEKIVKDLAYRTQMSMVMRIPRSGQPHPGPALRDTIKAEAKGRHRIDVTVGEGLYRPYHIYQEMGYARHAVMVSMHPEVYAYAQVDKYGNKLPWAVVSKHTSFVGPALLEVPRFIDSIIDKVLGTELRKAIK